MIRWLTAHPIVGHIVEALGLLLVAFILLALLVPWPTALLVAAYGPAQHFYGREKRDAEIRNAAKQPALKYYLPWTWGYSKGLWEFLPSVAIFLVVLTVLKVLHA